ncbi:glutathione S-transferase 1-like isoform X3 [Homalodisca vitripennis]|uniref:glutathione S-transferase 1-like isoform X3 n=1 Tax=Homalodisca vitripennis TaxID=197043 RepID=UPI001EEA129E|nr:glutathione S-transferase 1-like isoform X3 [Homalodisca vitripennis]XP_046680928.1 glutathione S-transferase 1-like isoform X3 [Homalodisca vitripennis]
MPLIFYYMDVSPPARSVDLVIHELGLTVQYKIVDLFKDEQLDPDYLKVNPLHTIPAIDDNGFVLWGSQAINTYLVSKYGKEDSLYPKNLQKRAIVDQRLHYSNDIFYVLKETARTLLRAGKIPLLELFPKIKEIQENVEKLLTGQRFIAGDTLTVADHSYVTYMDVFEVLSPTEDKFPLTKQWFARCKETMKDFEKVNKNGADLLISKLMESLSQG